MLLISVIWPNKSIGYMTSPNLLPIFLMYPTKIRLPKQGHIWDEKKKHIKNKTCEIIVEPATYS